MLLAMFAMVILMAVVGVITVTVRIKAVRRGDVHIKSFRLMNAEMPDIVQKTTRNFNNQFELPVLFYTVATLNLIYPSTTWVPLGLAWAFVISRYCHSVIHISYNHLLHRMAVFWAGIVMVIALWVELVLRIGLAS